jgi:hypothetical protein
MEALYGSSLLLEGHVHEKMNTNSKYEWNIGFIKLINRLECPYCGESLISKGILKTCRCGFYCLGSPETLYILRRYRERLPVIIMILINVLNVIELILMKI